MHTCGHRVRLGGLDTSINADRFFSLAEAVDHRSHLYRLDGLRLLARDIVRARRRKLGRYLRRCHRERRSGNKGLGEGRGGSEGIRCPSIVRWGSGDSQVVPCSSVAGGRLRLSGGGSRVLSNVGARSRRQALRAFQARVGGCARATACARHC